MTRNVPYFLFGQKIKSSQFVYLIVKFYLVPLNTLTIASIIVVSFEYFHITLIILIIIIDDNIANTELIICTSHNPSPPTNLLPIPPFPSLCPNAEKILLYTEDNIKLSRSSELYPKQCDWLDLENRKTRQILYICEEKTSDRGGPSRHLTFSFKKLALISSVTSEADISQL